MSVATLRTASLADSIDEPCAKTTYPVSGAVAPELIGPLSRASRESETRSLARVRMHGLGVVRSDTPESSSAEIPVRPEYPCRAKNSRHRPAPPNRNSWLSVPALRRQLS